jgi:tRNA(Arg) A34 adenosine deaminase TadA
VYTKDEFFLRQAIALAHQARQAGERPFGAIFVLNFEGFDFALHRQEILRKQ